MTNMPSSFSIACGVEAGSCGVTELGAAAGGGAAAGEDDAGGDSVFCPATERLKIRAKTMWVATKQIFHGSVIPSFRINLERRKSPWGVQLYFDFTPLTIVNGVLRSIPDHVLVSKFDANFGGDVGQIVRIIDGERTASGEFRNVAQQRWPETFLIGSEVVVVNTDGVDHYVGFLDEGLDFIFCVAAVVIAAVGNNQQGAFGIL